MAKTNEETRKSFETFREWVNDIGMNPTCIWCPKAASAYFYSKHVNAEKMLAEQCAECKFYRKAAG